MNCCSQQRGLNQIFNREVARREMQTYRKKGLNKRDRMLTQAIAQRGVQDATVLEIGGGVGGLQIELLRAGAARATNVDISQGYVESARELAQELGYAMQSEQRVLDFARESESVAPADVVMMNRVVCCYPDMPALVQPAAAHARRLLALSFPRESWWMRVGGRIINFGMWLLRRDFRFYVHPHAAIIQRVRAAGMQPLMDRFSGVWRLMLFERI